jgi:hypothetical protein
VGDEAPERFPALICVGLFASEYPSLLREGAFKEGCALRIGITVVGSRTMTVPESPEPEGRRVAVDFVEAT